MSYRKKDFLKTPECMHFYKKYLKYKQENPKPQLNQSFYNKFINSHFDKDTDSLKK